MNKSITVQEDTHKIWKIGSIISAALCVCFFLVHWNINDPFWAGIFQLVAFVFFAAAMLGGLKLMGSSLKVTLRVTEDFLLVTYKKKGKVVHEEQLKKNTIKKVVPVKPRGNLFHTFLQPSARMFEIGFTDTQNTIKLFEFGGRPLLFSPSSQQTIKDFLHQLGIKT